MEAKTKASVVFLMCLSVVLLSSVWYGLGFESHTSKIPLSKDQLNTIAKCRESEVNLLDVEFADSNLVCYPTTETKRDIAILSTYPVTGSTLIRSIFESVTGVSTYTQYAESSDYREACNFQDGPWKLYCQKGDNENECLHSHPPPKDIPYIVNTNYPIYSTICESYGYPLPRHEMAIHIVRNPIDSVEAWINYEYGDSIMANWNNNTLEGYLIDYLDWHTYFKNYHENEPDIPTIWIRYEDLHLCPKQTMEAIFSFTKTSSIVNQEKLNNDITYMTAKEPKKVGQAIPLLVFIL